MPSAVPRGRSAGLARRKVTRAPEAAAAGISAPGTDGGDDAAPRKASGKSAAVLAVALGALAWAGYVLTQNTVVGQAAYQALAKTGFTAAFALIFVSELGDKTFFIAALLAMRLGRFTVLTGAVCALSLMSFISVAIGKFFQQIPAAITTTLPVGEYLAVGLLLFFGVRTLKEALDVDEDGDEEDGELADAQEAVSKSEAGANKKQGFLAGFWETFTLVFIAEWGDRSMLATIALGAALMIALISVQLRDLGRTEHPFTIVFYFSLFSVPVLALAMPFVGKAHAPEEWLLLLACGVIGLLGQVLLTAALRYGAVANVIVMDYSGLIWATLFGWLVFTSLPPASFWFGAPLVVGAGLLIAWREHRLGLVRRALMEPKEA